MARWEGRQDRTEQAAHPNREAYHLRRSDSVEDPDWDAFLAGRPHADHVQSAIWAQVRSLSGWRVVRVVASFEDRIAGGAQLLIRSHPAVGSFGYVAKGPVLGRPDAHLGAVIIDELVKVARERRVRHVILQPPDPESLWQPILLNRHFQTSPIAIGPRATTTIDLANDLEQILAEMKTKTRYNVRLSQRRGLKVFEGEEGNIADFHRLLTATSERQEFSTSGEDYYRHLWRTLAGAEQVKLFFASDDDRVVSAMLAIAFGDTVTYKRGAWSGDLGSARPNEAIHWAAISWAKTHGYRYYDFEGIELEIARAILGGENPDPHAMPGVTRFKIGFGGTITTSPDPYYYSTVGFFRWFCRMLCGRVANWGWGNRAANWLRTR